MRLENAVASDVLERILSAYGFTMQKELSDRLGIAKSNVASWLQRGQVPGNVLVQCALDTGTDVNWLVTGELENASQNISQPETTGKALYDEIMSNGGKAVLRRIMDAYGFTLQKELCELLGISSGTVSTWVRREYFPGDVVVACALETGVSLRWIATGKGEAKTITSSSLEQASITLPKMRLESGRLKAIGSWSADPSMFNATSVSAAYVEGIKYSWLVDLSQTEIGNGRWIVIVDGSYDVYDVVRLPAGKIRLVNASIEFECSLTDIDVYGTVLFTFEKHL
ncbi:phage repressor protein CI [Rouxiella badensis]|uniref:phage repressor protein CI n=1 Tax=Rouxiella badensis TaxID=1646377 RepID=UPI0013EEF60B|nr:phage repressor protein CI [Rouxiella badensis]QII37388.1 phage repressor protein CI [Rouxiella badensis]